MPDTKNVIANIKWAIGDCFIRERNGSIVIVLLIESECRSSKGYKQNKNIFLFAFVLCTLVVYYQHKFNETSNIWFIKMCFW